MKIDRERRKGDGREPRGGRRGARTRLDALRRSEEGVARVLDVRGGRAPRLNSGSNVLAQKRG